MERRAFLSALLGGIGVSFIASQAQALPRLAPPEAAGLDPAAPAPQFGVATPEDMKNAHIEKSWWRWRRRYWRRRYYWGRPYWRRRYWRRRYWW